MDRVSSQILIFFSEKGFDVQVLTLTLMINLMEHCDQNRDLLLKAFLPRKSDDFVR